MEKLAVKIFAQLARQFPVCMASDEFHFFPQGRTDTNDWSTWDDFSDESIQEACGQIDFWLAAISKQSENTANFETIADSFMLQKMLSTLREQFALVAPQKYQPTFYLTILALGLAEAIEDGGSALRHRLQTLPGFISQACRNLIEVPRIFLDTGIKMLEQVITWLQQIPVETDQLAPVLKALNGLSVHLNEIPVSSDFLPGPDLYAHIATNHMGCDMPIQAIAEELDREVEETRHQLKEWAAQSAPGKSWQTAIASLPKPALPAGSVQKLYHKAIYDLGAHCAEKGFLHKTDLGECPVTVSPVPDYMRPVRNSAAYSMPPHHPPSGGTFFIAPERNINEIPADYQLLSAHEAYPGHHLLDMNRWRHPRRVRRHIEFPLFYEGWACFAEELMFETGFFSTSAERALLAQRCFWRAVRGRVDIDLHTRQKSPDEATDFLCGFGMDRPAAAAMVGRYLLKPGYQLAYGIGRRRFRRFFDQFSGQASKPADFVKRVLSAGQIGFHHLAKILQTEGVL